MRSYTDRLMLVCREGHPCLRSTINEDVLQHYEHTLLMLEGQNLSALRQRVQDLFPELTSALAVTICSLSQHDCNSDMLGLMPTRLFKLFSACWPLVGN